MLKHTQAVNNYVQAADYIAIGRRIWFGSQLTWTQDTSHKGTILLAVILPPSYQLRHRVMDKRQFRMTQSSEWNKASISDLEGMGVYLALDIMFEWTCAWHWLSYPKGVYVALVAMFHFWWYLSEVETQTRCEQLFTDNRSHFNWPYTLIWLVNSPKPGPFTLWNHSPRGHYACIIATAPPGLGKNPVHIMQFI